MGWKERPAVSSDWNLRCQKRHVRHVFACGRETVRAFYNFLNLHTCLNLNTCRCHATSGLAHMFDATQHHGLGWGGGWGGGDDDVLWACTHVGCYGTADVL